MVKKSVYFGVLLFLLELFFVSPAFSISYEVDECVSYATGKHSVGSTWTETRGGTKYSCRCDARQGTVCTPISGTRSPSMPSGSLRPSQQLAVGILGALFSGLFSDLFAPPDTSNEDTIRKQQEEKLKKQQEEKRQALEKWMNLQAKAESERLNEEAEKRKKGKEILAKTSIGGGGLTMESIGSRQLTPFNLDTPGLSATPAPSGHMTHPSLQRWNGCYVLHISQR